MPSSSSGPTAYNPAAGEKLIIETPEQTSIEFPLAGIGSRFLAILVDSLIQGAVIFVLGMIVLVLGLGYTLTGLGRLSSAPIWVLAILILLYFFLMYGYFMMFEAIWKTVVVHEKPFENIALKFEATAPVATHHYGANRLTAEEVALVEAFLSRRSALEAGVRYDTAANIVRRIESKLTIPPERPSAEKLLEELSYERRSSAGYR